MDTKYTTLIERYFDQQLSPEEKVEVEQLRATDLDFQEEFELFEKANQAVQLATAINLKEEIKDIHDSMEATSATPIFTFRRIGIAASVLLIVGFGVYAQQYSNQNLYDEAYAPVGDYVTNMDNEISQLEKAMELFDQQQYDNAQRAFNQIYTTTGDQIALFYAGHCHYQAGKFEEAISALSKIDNNYQAEAQWYIALAYLKLEKLDNTNNVLQSIIDNKQDEAFVLKAKRLKEQLASPLRILAF